ncbi:hypothetical protein PIB30_015935 [Stylosanthes scabra]|uniref:Uncharacterized protein n=1 Tax=Stylosanthes scabra TaxID=79078 RepID=A0ABU6U8S6_9FABA|nr:hypothetical protein [Stylosanthes scabra]
MDDAGVVDTGISMDMYAISGSANTQSTEINLLCGSVDEERKIAEVEWKVCMNEGVHEFEALRVELLQQHLVAVCIVLDEERSEIARTRPQYEYFKDNFLMNPFPTCRPLLRWIHSFWHVEVLIVRAIPN